MVQEKDEIVLKDHVGGTIIAHFEIKNKINKVNIKDKENVNRIFQVFGISKTFIGKMAITYLIKITIVINGLLVKIPK